MPVTSTPYRLAVTGLLSGTINYPTDVIRCLLVTSSYTPNFDTDRYKDVVSAIGTNEVVGTGYTAGGQALTSKTVVYTAANSWATSWTTATGYVAGQIIKPAAAQNNGHLYRVVVAGTSGVTQPTWPTVAGQTVQDNAGPLLFEETGSGITVITSAAPSWASSTITAAGAVFYDDTPASNKPLLDYVAFGGNVSSTNGTFTVTPDSQLGIIYFPEQ